MLTEVSVVHLSYQAFFSGWGGLVEMSVLFAYVCERARARACVRSCARVSVCMREREAERERDRQTDRRAERDRQTDRETEREETGRQSRLYQVGETQSRQTCVFVCVCVQLIGQR